MLISVCQGTFADAVRLSSRCNTNCKLHTDEGDGCFFGFAFEGCLRVRSPWVLLLQPAANCALFAFVRCYCFCVGALVCACTLFVAVYLPFARLLLLLQYFVHLARFRASCGLYCSRVYCSLFCAPPVRRFNDSEGQRWEEGRGTSPRRLRGCVL